MIPDVYREKAGEEYIAAVRERRDVEFAVINRAIVMQVDDELVTNWVTVKDNDYKQALHNLVGFCIQVENDPAVSESAKARQEDRDRLLEVLAEFGGHVDAARNYALTHQILLTGDSYLETVLAEAERLSVENKQLHQALSRLSAAFHHPAVSDTPSLADGLVDYVLAKYKAMEEKYAVVAP